MIRILVPLDGSPVAETAIPHATAIARTFSAEIELFGVVCEPGPGSGEPVSSVDWQLWKRQTEVYLARIADAMKADRLRVSWQLREGDAAQEILQRAREADVDLLVMTRYGKGNARQFDSGGTAHKVMSACTASVLLVEPGAGPSEGDGYRRILVVVDDSQRSEWATGFAAMVARASSASLHLLRTLDEPYVAGDLPVNGEARRLLAQLRQMANSQARLKLRNLRDSIGTGLSVSASVLAARQTDMPSRIEDHADEIGADLIVMASGEGRLCGINHYGPVCENLLHHARRPVLVLSSEAAVNSIDHFRSLYLEEPEIHADAV